MNAEQAPSGTERYYRLGGHRPARDKQCQCPEVAGKFRSTPCHDPAINRGRNEPIVQLVPHPVGYWNSSDVASLTKRVDNRPVLLALLKMTNLKVTAS